MRQCGMSRLLISPKPALSHKAVRSIHLWVHVHDRHHYPHVSDDKNAEYSCFKLFTVKSGQCAQFALSYTTPFHAALIDLLTCSSIILTTLAISFVS
jgi:hypothetical protein